MKRNTASGNCRTAISRFRHNYTLVIATLILVIGIPHAIATVNIETDNLCGAAAGLATYTWSGPWNKDPTNLFDEDNV